MLYPTEGLALEVQFRNRVQDEKIPLHEDSQIMKSSERKQGKEALLISLIQRSRDGDSQAMEAVYEHYKRPLFNLIYRFTSNFHLAEDLLQETFLKVFSHIQDIENVDVFKNWLYRIAVNTCNSYFRESKAKLHKKVPMSEVEGTLAGKMFSSQDREMESSLDEAIKSLAPKMKSVFLLHDVQGFKHEEIARMLGWSVGTSKSQLFKARMKIRDYFKNN